MSESKKQVNSFIDFLRSIKSTMWRFLKCIIVAVIGYWVDFGLYALIITQWFDVTIEEADRGNLAPEISMTIFCVQAVTYVIGLAVNFLLNKHWSFGIKKDYSQKYIFRFIVVTAIAFLAKQFCVYILTNYYVVDALLSVLAASLFTFIINYSGNLLWVFNVRADNRNKKKKLEKGEQ